MRFLLRRAGLLLADLAHDLSATTRALWATLQAHRDAERAAEALRTAALAHELPEHPLEGDA